MTARFLIDTNIASAAINDGGSSVARKIRGLAPDAIVTSAIVAGELRFGAAKKGSSILAERIEALLSFLQILPVDIEVTRGYAEIRKSLEQRGMPIGQNDLWIAASARSANLVLVTDNVGEFSRVEGLRIENWIRDIS